MKRSDEVHKRDVHGYRNRHGRRESNFEVVLDDLYESRLAVVMESIIIGLVVALVVSPFRWIVTASHGVLKNLYAFLRAQGLRGWYWTALLAAAFALVGLLLGLASKFRPMIKGSGIPQVEGCLARKLSLDWRLELPLKWLTSILAVCCGMSLGREGPLILIGAYTGMAVLTAFRRPHNERKIMVTAAAAAGMSAAFGAPLAGILFAVEELQSSLTPLFLCCAMAASMTASVVTGSILGIPHAFNLVPAPALPLAAIPHVIILGVIIGIVGDLFKRCLYFWSDFYAKLHSKFRVPTVAMPIIPLLAAIIAGFYLFDVTGGGHFLIESLDTGVRPFHTLLLLLAAKIIFTGMCFGSGSSGGIFLPFLTVGAITGTAYFEVLDTLNLLPGSNLYINFVILGMAGMFAAVVRAPVTGVVLILEMCGNFTQLYWLVLVAFAAYLSTELMNSAPVYNVLLARIIKE